MKNIYVTGRGIALAAILAISTTQAAAQGNLGLYHFNVVGQNIMVNPAAPQAMRMVVALPALGGIHAGYNNSGFRLKDILAEGSDINSDIDKVISGLDKRDNIAIQEQVDLVFAGFGIKNGYISFGAYQRFDYHMDYPVDLLKLVFYGNGAYAGESLDISDFRQQTSNTTVAHIGYQHRLLDDRLTVGGRFKYILGNQNTFVERSGFSITTGENAAYLNVQTDVAVHTSGIGEITDEFSISRALFNRNRGFAVDLGAHYKITKKLSASLSLIDVGSITWNNDVKSYTSKGEYQFDGIDLDLSGEDFNTAFEAITDSLKEAFDFREEEGGSYRTALPASLYAGAQYQLTKRHSFGGIYAARIMQGRFYHSVSVNYYGRLFRMLQLMASYNVINGTYSNVGAGLSLKFGPVQLYALSDNALGFTNISAANNLNFRFGINIALYKKTSYVEEITQ